MMIEKYRIPEPQNINAIMKIIGDKDMSKMMNCVLDKSLSRDNIIKDTGVCQTTAYNKLKTMINTGILVEHGNEFSITRTCILKYTTPFKTIHVSIRKNNNILIELVAKKDLEEHCMLIAKVFI